MQVNKQRRVVFCALFASLIAVSNFFIIPLAGLVPVPIVLKNLFIVLSGTLLGSFYGGLAVLIFIAAGLIGVPVFVIPGGFGVFATPLAGYIIGYLFGSLAAGLIAGTPVTGRKNFIRVTIGSFFGFLIILICGTFYMMCLNNLTLAAAITAGVVPFLIGDLIKFVISIPLSISLRPIVARYI